jgi:electron transfer flavoprotein alpha subunit
MKVLVFVKQIPDVHDIKFDSVTNRILREGVPLMMNSFDKKAVEEAIRLGEKYGAETIIASMGPPSAVDVLNEGMKMGIQKGYLLTDRKFGGSDTQATSTILSRFASTIKPAIILTGKYSLDGETSQVPPEIAVKLSYNFKSSISKIEVNGDKAVVEHENELGLYNIGVTLPAVFSVSEKINKARPIKPGAPDYSDSIVTIDSSTLKLDSNGVDMSPTVVFATKTMQSTRRCEILETNQDVFRTLTAILKENQVKAETSSKVPMPSFSLEGPLIMGIALDDPQISVEIATKISSLAMSNNLNPVMLGNIPQEKLKGMRSPVYYHLGSQDLFDMLTALLNFIDEKHPEYVIFPSTTRGRELAGTIAGELNLGLTADCVDLEIDKGRLIQHKPSFGGSIIASIYSKTKPAMATVRPGIFETMLTDEAFQVKELDVESYRHEEILSFSPVPEEYQPLHSGRIVFGIGRGATSKETIKKVLQLAQMTGGTIGASRPVVDMGLIPRQQQIGLTGYSISPDVYIALGISGQANHVVGLRYCKKVIAINTDPNSMIFKFADYGLIMDVTKFLDGMISQIDTESSTIH